jgi:hypothetical protein
MNGLDDIRKTSKDIIQQLQQTIQDHDRYSLSKKFPKSLRSSPLPNFSNFRLD